MNKKIILLTGVLTIVGHLAFAQILTGPKGGFTLSTMHFDSKQYTKDYEIVWRPGFTAGWVFNYSAANSTMWSFHGELYYSQKGRTIQRRGADYVKNKTRFHNIDLPAMFRGTFSLGSIKWYANAGPALSYWLHTNGQISSGELDEYEAGDINYTYDFSKKNALPGERTDRLGYGVIEVPYSHRLQVGLQFGFGFEFPVLTGKVVQLDFRYNMGHTNIGEKEDDYINLLRYMENFEGSNRSLEVSMAFLMDYNILAKNKGKSTTQIK